MHKSLLLFFLLSTLAFSQKLIMVNQLFRHGARYPVYPKSNDGSANYTNAEHSFGQLTTNGKKMHYLLGKELYKTYWMALFQNTKYEKDYNQSKFYIKSTDVNRTIESVQSQMMGIMENLPALNLTQNMVQFSQPQWPGVHSQKGDVFPQARTFHPISIHVQKVGTDPFNSGDFLRTYSSQNCPSQLKWEKQNRNTAKVKQMVQHPRFKSAIQALSNELKSNITFWDAPAYYDNYECAKYMGRDFLKTFQNPEYLYSLDYIHTLEMYINLYMSPQQIRATATGFFNQTVHNMKAIIKDPEAVQWNIYSAHDTTVGNMIAALNLTNVDCIYQAFLQNSTTNSDTCISQYPLYTSNIIFELYETNKTSHFIKIRYNGIYKKIPFCDWSYECPVTRFYMWYENFKDENFLSTCGIYQSDLEKYFSIAAAEFMIILTFLIWFLIKYLKNGLKKHQTSAAVTKKGENLNDTIINNKPAEAAPLAPQSNYFIKQSLLTNEA